MAHSATTLIPWQPICSKKSSFLVGIPLLWRRRWWSLQNTEVPNGSLVHTFGKDNNGYPSIIVSTTYMQWGMHTFQQPSITLRCLHPKIINSWIEYWCLNNLHIEAENVEIFLTKAVLNDNVSISVKWWWNGFCGLMTCLEPEIHLC